MILFCNYCSVFSDRLSSIGCLEPLWIELFSVMRCVMRAVFEWLSIVISLFGALHKAGGSSHRHFSASGLCHLFFGCSSCFVPCRHRILHFVQLVWPLPIFTLDALKLFSDFVKALPVWPCIYIFARINSPEALQELILFVDRTTLIPIRGDGYFQQAPG